MSWQTESLQRRALALPHLAQWPQRAPKGLREGELVRPTIGPPETVLLGTRLQARPWSWGRNVDTSWDHAEAVATIHVQSGTRLVLQKFHLGWEVHAAAVSWPDVVLTHSGVCSLSCNLEGLVFLLPGLLCSRKACEAPGRAS